MGEFSSRSQPRRDGEAESDAEEESGSSGSGTATQQTETGEHETEDLQRATAATQAPTSTTGGESPGDGVGGETSERTAPGIGRRLAPETDSTNAVVCGKRLAPEIDSSQSGPSKGVSSITRLSDATRAYGDNSATDYAGETDVPDTVRDVISSPGQSLDADIQRTMESEMGDSFSDVQVHTGPQAAQACEDINAKAFTVGNNIAFNQGEYDPGSAEGQHTIAHELAHVRQQTGGAVSMLPQDDVELEIDPDPELEQEAEETAQRVMQGGELGIHRMAETDVHVQRIPKDKMFETLALFDTQEDVGNFRQQQDERQKAYLLDELQNYIEVEGKLEEVENKREAKQTVEEGYASEDDLTNEAEGWMDIDFPSHSEIEAAKENVEDSMKDKVNQIALTDEQWSKVSDGIDDSTWTDVTATVGATALSTAAGVAGGPLAGAGVSIGTGLMYTYASNHWDRLDGDLKERAQQLKEIIQEDAWTEGDSTGDLDMDVGYE